LLLASFSYYFLGCEKLQKKNEKGIRVQKRRKINEITSSAKNKNFVISLSKYM